METIRSARQFSEQKLKSIRDDLATSLPKGTLAVTCGSYARRDASAESDLDYFLVRPDVDADQTADSIVAGVVQRVVGRPPSVGGAFASTLDPGGLTRNVGGYEDSNHDITRRILLLLEGDYLYNKEDFLKLRKNLLEFYLNNTPDCHQIAFYLLNDIVRYWRTIAVDYAHKTSGKDAKKPWGVRNIKLVYSRKLLYASGIFSVALTADRTLSEKIRILEMLFGMTPLDRIAYVCGEASSERLFQLYDQFLEKISDGPLRHHLDGLDASEKASDERFRFLKNESHYFSRELMGLLQRTFHSSHPIHMALVF